MPILRPHAAQFQERRISSVTFTSENLYGNVYVAACLPIRPILGFWGAKFTKIGDSQRWTPVNRRIKYDADSFILGGEIRNRTNTQKTQTVTDISTPCLTACVDNSAI